MTLTQIATLVCKTIGQFDAESMAAAKAFANRRYTTLIWDAHPWRDAQITDTVTVTATGSATLPPTMDRVIAARANGRFLDPVDAAYLIQTDPTIFERAGNPTVYEEWTDPAAANARKIRLYPKPATNTPVLLVGKRIPAALGDNDSPILRNIDNALIAYTHADMLRRERHYAKANVVFEEANALLAAAKAVETDQANKPRRSKNLTAAGNTLAELADAVCARVGSWSLDDIIIAKDLLRRNYQTVYDSQIWKESTVVASVASDGEQIVLPHYFDRVMSIRVDSSLGSLVPVDTGLLFGIMPSIFEQTTGPQLQFSMLAPSATKKLPPGREKLWLVSDDVNDKGSVYIVGEDAGEEVRETVTLNGTTVIETENYYDVALTISKGVTQGTVSIVGATSTVELGTIPPDETERKHIRLWLLPANVNGRTCLVLGKRKIRPLVTDEDTPMLRDIQSALIEMTVGDMLAMKGKVKEAQDARAKAASAIQILSDLESKQGASAPRVVPMIGDSWGYDGNGSWISDKSYYV